MNFSKALICGLAVLGIANGGVLADGNTQGLDTEPYYVYAAPDDGVQHDVEVPG